MLLGRSLALPLMLATPGCTTPPSDKELAEQEKRLAELVAEVEETQRQSRCGLRGAMGLGSGERRQIGDAVRACELPSVANVERACEVHEAVPNPDKRDPEDPGSLMHDFPDYTVSDLNCAFEDAENSRATCTFMLTTASVTRQPTRAVLTYRYSARSTPLLFEQFTTWSTPASCLPRKGTDQAS